MKAGTEVKNRIHSLLDKHGLRIPDRTPFSKKNIAWLKEQSFSLMEDTILHSDLAILEAYEEQRQPSQRVDCEGSHRCGGPGVDESGVQASTGGG